MSVDIPIRNIWLLFLYAADLAQFKNVLHVDKEAARDLPELVASVLTNVVEKRLGRNLSRGYVPRHAVLSRVRGRIDVLATTTGQWLEKGRVACRFQEHTLDIPRNRLVRAALDFLAAVVDRPDLAHKCRALSQLLGRQGVSSLRPSRADLASDQISRNEADDVPMVSLAKMVFDVFIPNEQEGQDRAATLDYDAHLIRRVFEKAIRNALRIQLQPLGWRVQGGCKLRWPVDHASEGIMDHLPSMRTDIELVHTGQRRKIVIDTKFTKIFSDSLYRSELLASDYLYQLYTYLNTQTAQQKALGIDYSEGMLLHPMCGRAVDAYVDMQGHRLQFRTIDLTSSADEFERQLQTIVSDPEMSLQMRG